MLERFKNEEIVLQNTQCAIDFLKSIGMKQGSTFSQWLIVSNADINRFTANSTLLKSTGIVTLEDFMSDYETQNEETPLEQIMRERFDIVQGDEFNISYIDDSGYNYNPYSIDMTGMIVDCYKDSELEVIFLIMSGDAIIEKIKKPVKTKKDLEVERIKSEMRKLEEKLEKINEMY